MSDPDHFDTYIYPDLGAIYNSQRSIPAEYTISRDPCGHISISRYLDNFAKY